MKLYEVKNPLEFDQIEAEIEEWRNIPSLVARYCIILHEHLKHIIKYNKTKSTEENTGNLRKFIEKEIKKTNQLQE